MLKPEPYLFVRYQANGAWPRGITAFRQSWGPEFLTLAVRFLEEAGFSTVILTPTRNFIAPSESLEVLEDPQTRGEIWHLPFTWPEEPKKTAWQPLEMSPLIKLYLADIRHARQLDAEGESAKSPTERRAGTESLYTLGWREPRW